MKKGEKTADREAEEARIVADAAGERGSAGRPYDDQSVNTRPFDAQAPDALAAGALAGGKLPSVAALPDAVSVDDRDVIEIEVELTDDTFDVEGKTRDQVGIKVHMPVRLKIGIAIVVFAFMMSGSVAVLLPWAMATSNAPLQWWCGVVYIGSWVVLGLGVLIGGRSAKDIVTGWTVKAMGRRFGSLRDRRTTRI